MVSITQGHIAIGGGQSVSGDSAPPPPADLGAANFRKDIFPGLTQETTLSGVVGEALGFSIEQQLELLTNEALGLTVDTFASGTAIPEQEVGLTQGSILTMNNLPEKSSGFSIDQISYDYVGNKHVLTATNTGSESFSSTTNAHGAPDGTRATVNGQALSATSAALECVHDSVGVKDSLNIDLVELRFYVEQVAALSNGGMTLDYRIGNAGGWTNLATYSGSVNFVTNPPDVYDLTGVVTGWDDIRDLETRVTATFDVATVGVSVQVDAITKHIEASLID